MFPRHDVFMIFDWWFTIAQLGFCVPIMDNNGLTLFWYVVQGSLSMEPDHTYDLSRAA